MYVKTVNGQATEFPYTALMLKRDNPNVSFPNVISEETFNSFNVFSVERNEIPEFNMRTQELYFAELPTFIDGKWVQEVTVVNKTQEQIEKYDEVKAGEMRWKRDTLIAETDWWASSDLTMTAEQTAYRQALRDISSHANWPNLEEADWPTKP
jgi:hypothetical protein